VRHMLTVGGGAAARGHDGGGEMRGMRVVLGTAVLRGVEVVVKCDYLWFWRRQLCQRTTKTRHEYDVPPPARWLVSMGNEIVKGNCPIGQLHAGATPILSLGEGTYLDPGVN